MRILRYSALITVLFAGSAFGASKEIMELQRDIAQLQAQLQALQSSQDQKLAAIQALVTQSLDAAGKANTAVSVLSSSGKKQIKATMTTVEVIPKPNHTMNSGAKASLGTTWLNTT